MSLAHKTPKHFTRCCAALLFALSVGCGDDNELATTNQRGAPALAGGGGGGAGGAAAAAEGDAAAEDPAANRPKIQLTRESFAAETRDPFQSFIGGQVDATNPEGTRRDRPDRKVLLQEYGFEDLRPVAIVHSGRNIVPRALFVATDGKSKTIQQGEFFSRAEVLLAAVNKQYIEIEVVDEDLANSLNMAKGERRALYLTNE